MSGDGKIVSRSSGASAWAFLAAAWWLGGCRVDQAGLSPSSTDAGQSEGGRQDSVGDGGAQEPGQDAPGDNPLDRRDGKTPPDPPPDRAPDFPRDRPDDAILAVMGCSDGTREGLQDTKTFDRIAGCAGGWSIPGVRVENPPTCTRLAGNDGLNPSGTGCNATDLCADGWHVCRSDGELFAKMPVGTACGDVDWGADPVIFITRWGNSSHGTECSEVGDNELWGCGNIGKKLAQFSFCMTLNRKMTGADCTSHPPWSCGSGAGDDPSEATLVVKDGPTAGGVLCCHD